MLKCILIMFLSTSLACLPSKKCPEPIGNIHVLNCESNGKRVQKLHQVLSRLELPATAFDDLTHIKKQLYRGCMRFNRCQYTETEYRMRRDKLLAILTLIDNTLENLEPGVEKQEVREVLVYLLAQSRNKDLFP